MLYSNSHQEKAFDFFASFLRYAIEGDTKYKALIEPVIEDAKLLVQEKKDYFGINRNGFDVIVFLAKKDPDFFKEIDTHELSADQYRHILDLITEQRGLILA